MRNEERFIEMLQYTRPHKGKSEQEYLERFIVPNIDWEDKSGNMIKIIGDKNPRIMFSSHTDTVHKHDGKQQLFTDDCGTRVFSDSTCLGADDTVGNYLMLTMIEEKIPGLYIFHRGEERGGIGSTWIASETPNLLEHIEIAIALDRKGTDDVVQYQNGSRCCSEQFASELADLMEITGGDNWGSFTDTAMYTDLVKECTNISVAYWNQHSKNEVCNTHQIGIIEERLLKADWDSLKAYGYEDEDQWSLSYGHYVSTGYERHERPLQSSLSDNAQYSDEYWDLHDIVTYEPDTVIDYLYECGISASDIIPSHRSCKVDNIDPQPDPRLTGNGNTRSLWDGVP